MSNNTLQRYDSIESAKNLPGATLENPRPDIFDNKVRLNFKRKLVFKEPNKNTNNKRRKKRGGKSLTKKRKTKKRRRRRRKTKRRKKRRTRRS